LKFLSSVYKLIYKISWKKIAQ